MDIDDLNKIKSQLDNIVIDIKLNVQNIYTDVYTGNKTFTFHSSQPNLKSYVFFSFETPYHNAFAHWVFESAVFLPYIKYFLSKQNFYILVNKNYERKYKKLFFKLFNIDEDRIWYIDNDPLCTHHISYENIPENNICIICKNFTLNTKILPSCSFEIFKNLINNFYNEIDQNLKKDSEKTIDNLFLPRDIVENFIPNDRKFDYTKCNEILKSEKYTKYYTNNTEDFIEQINLLRSSKNIYVCWGSAHIVNGFFSQNSNIFVICNNTPYRYHRDYSLYMYIYDFIENNNNNKIIAI